MANNPGNNDPQKLNIDYTKLSQAEQNIDNIRDAAGNINAAFKDINKNVREFNNLTDQLNKALQDSIKSVKDMNSDYVEYYKLKKKVQEAQDKILENQEKISKISQKLNQSEIEAVQKIGLGIQARRDLGEYLSKSQQAQQDLNDAITAGNTRGRAFNDLKEKAVIAAEKLKEKEQQVVELAKIMEGKYADVGLNANNINSELLRQIIQLALANERYDDIVDNNKNSLALLEKQTSAWQKTASVVNYYYEKINNSKIYSTINGYLATLGFGWKSILDSLMEYNKMLVDSAKQLGISVDGARKLADGYQKTSYNVEQYNKNANAALMTIKAQFEAQQQLNDALGTAGLFTAKSRIDQAFLTKQVGLQGEEAAKLYQLGQLNEKTAEDAAKIVAQEVINSGKQNNNKLNYKKVLQDVAKIEGQLAAQYLNNPKLIAEAVTQAKQLGLELGQTAKMADSLLNFESSISNELKAELLTGKALNLEQARYYALMGDSAKAAKELMDNVGGLGEFQKLNVIQQRSLAEAIGMSADELSNSLKTQELLKGTQFETQAAFEEAVKLAKTQEEKDALRQQILQATNADQLLAQAAQISNQEKFNAAIDKLKESLASIVDGPMGQILDWFANVLSSAEALKGIMFAIGGVLIGNMLKGIASFGISMAAAIAPTSEVAAASIATASAWTLGLGVAAIIAGLIAGVVALNSATGENISVNQASGGGINSSNITNSEAARAAQADRGNPDRPIVIKVDNSFSIANKNVGVFSNTLQSNNTPYDKT